MYLATETVPADYTYKEAPVKQFKMPSLCMTSRVTHTFFTIARGWPAVVNAALIITVFVADETRFLKVVRRTAL